MSIEINRSSMDLVSTPVAMPASSGLGVSQATPISTEPRKPLVQERPLVDIKVDVEQMRQNLEQTISQLNQTLKDGGRGISFQMDSALNGPIVTVMNDSTGEVIRQLPNAAVVSVAHNMQQLKGLLHNAIV
jgi:flagellar protein FlaG